MTVGVARLWSRPGRALSGVLLLVLGWAVFMAPASVQALDVPPKPTDVPVVDQTGTLSEEQRQALGRRIAEERAATGNQIAILMIKSLEGRAIEDYSLAVARGWGIGQQDRNSGVLLLVAKDDRRMRIEVGYGLEGALTDIRSGQIIRDRITPQFRAGKFYEGLNEGLSGIIAAVHNEADPNLKPEGSSAGGGGSWLRWIDNFFWLLLVVPVWLGSILARTKSWWAGGVIGGVAGLVIALFAGFVFAGLLAIILLGLLGLLFDWLVSRNFHQAVHGDRSAPSWWAGGPWLGGGGSGSGGFGGGDFGGGGASGGW